MYAVFTNTILADKEKYLVQHEGDYNAHTIHKEFLAHISASTESSVVSSTILMYITPAKFGIDAWNGLSESFILHWRNQVSEYEKLVDITDRFSNTIKRSMLENAVDQLAKLRDFKTTATQLQVSNGTIISYDRYISLLYRSTQSSDTQFTTSINFKGQKRTEYQHETTSYENNKNYEHHVDINIEYLIIKFTDLNLAK